MYRCELCNTVQPPRSRSVRVTIESRATEYPSRPKANKLRIGRKTKHFDDPGGAGYEIAKEAIACPKCAHTHEAKRAAEEPGDDFGDSVSAGLDLSGVSAPAVTAD